MEQRSLSSSTNLWIKHPISVSSVRGSLVQAVVATARVVQIAVAQDERKRSKEAQYTQAGCHPRLSTFAQISTLSLREQGSVFYRDHLDDGIYSGGGYVNAN